MKAEAPAIATDVLLEFMFRLGQAYLASGEQTAQVELLLRRTASASSGSSCPARSDCSASHA